MEPEEVLYHDVWLIILSNITELKDIVALRKTCHYFDNIIPATIKQLTSKDTKIVSRLDSDTQFKRCHQLSNIIFNMEDISLQKLLHIFPRIKLLECRDYIDFEHGGCRFDIVANYLADIFTVKDISEKLNRTKIIYLTNVSSAYGYSIFHLMIGGFKFNNPLLHLARERYDLSFYKDIYLDTLINIQDYIQYNYVNKVHFYYPYDIAQPENVDDGFSPLLYIKKLKGITIIPYCGSEPFLVTPTNLNAQCLLNHLKENKLKLPQLITLETLNPVSAYTDIKTYLPNVEKVSFLLNGNSTSDLKAILKDKTFTQITIYANFPQPNNFFSLNWIDYSKLPFKMSYLVKKEWFSAALSSKTEQDDRL